jgi:ATP-dependent DNA helicase RecG
VSGSQLSDLDLDEIERYLRQRAPILLEELGLEEGAQRLGLAARSGPRLVPSVLGLLLFGRYPQLFRPHWGLSAVRVRGRHLSDPVAHRADFEGPVTALLEQAQVFVREHTQVVTDPDSSRPAACEYPEAAVREAICNALLHRDLRLTGRVAVRLFDDRLEIWNPGGPLRLPVELDELTREGGVSMPRNPLLAAAARTLGMGEQIGRGLPLMRREVAQLTNQPIELATSQVDVLIVLPSALQSPTDSTRLS